MPTADSIFNIRDFSISYEGAQLLANLGPGSNPDEVVAAFAMIGYGDDARAWRSLVRRAQIASDTLSTQAAKIIPPTASLVEVLLAGDTPTMRTLSEDAALQRRLAAEAWTVLGDVIYDVRAKIPGFDH